MWVVYALGSALFAGLTAILAKIGIENVKSNLATALRTCVVLAFSWLMVAIGGSWRTIGTITGRSLLFLILSGFATGASWLCYFRALQLGDVSKVTPIDKSSTVLTMLLAFFILGEALTWVSVTAMALIFVGTMLMIATGKPHGEEKKGDAKWLFWAVLSAVFAALTSILAKIGIENVDSTLGTAIRTIVVLIMAWGIVLAQGQHRQIGGINAKSWLFLVLSGFATGLSWLCYYRALKDGPASVVVPVDKLSIVVTVAFSALFLKERLSRRALAGLALIVAGTLLMVFFS